jgi:1-acyl-sn-glycerol-3-phosphate acyltransferase
VRAVPLADSIYAVAQTLRISAPTVLDSALGRLSLEQCDARLDEWSGRVVARTQMDLRVHGPEPDWSRAYVVMSNHQSHYDIPVLFRVVRGRMRMVTKKELFKFPVFGKAMRDAGFIEIDRTDRQSAIASLRTAAEQLRSGTHVWIAPEGTRSKDGTIGTLKKGGFVLARDTGLPILPIAIRGTIDVLPRGTTRTRLGQRVDVTLGTPIETQDTSVPIETLMSRLREFLVAQVAAAPRGAR